MAIRQAWRGHSLAVKRAKPDGQRRARAEHLAVGVGSACVGWQLGAMGVPDVDRPMEAEILDHVWSIEDIVTLLEDDLNSHPF